MCNSILLDGVQCCGADMITFSLLRCKHFFCQPYDLACMNGWQVKQS